MSPLACCVGNGEEYHFGMSSHQILSVGFPELFDLFQLSGMDAKRWLRRSWVYRPVQAPHAEGRNVARNSIWVDADACPKVIKEILFRAAERTGVTVTLVANRSLAIPRIASLRVLQVGAGFDVADKVIANRAMAGDLVITADVPLAAEIIEKGGEALNPRGERYSQDTIRGVLTMRDFMDTMRASGHVGGGPSTLTQADRNAFASHLDKWLARLPKT